MENLATTTLRVAPPAVVFRWDLDKTYLRTEFDRFRDMIRVPFEKPEEKIEVPGVADLIRAIREHGPRAGRRPLVYFISASPPQLGRAIREKFALDGVEIDGIVFKDQLRILMRGRFRGLREQIGFKLTELLQGRLAFPGDAPEYLFGDDWESDPLSYSLYADALRGRLEAEEVERLLGELGVDREWRRRVRDLLGRVSRGDGVRRIFINLERVTPPGTFRAFGPRLVATFNYVQTAACLYEEGQIAAGGVETVARALVARHDFTPEMLENSLEDVARRGHLGELAHLRLARELRLRGLLPERRLPLRRRIQRRVDLLRARFRHAREVVRGPDYDEIVGVWRADR